MVTCRARGGRFALEDRKGLRSAESDAQSLTINVRRVALSLEAALLQGRGAGIADHFQFGQERVPAIFGESGKDLRLELEGELFRAREDLHALFQDDDAMRAPVTLMEFSGDQARFLHARKSGSDGVGVAGHEVRNLALGEAGRITFVEPSEDAELVRGDSQVGHSLAKSLIESIPGAPQQGRQTLLFGVARGLGHRDKLTTSRMGAKSQSGRGFPHYFSFFPGRSFRVRFSKIQMPLLCKEKSALSGQV
jgi:hypothetical protein